MGRWQERQSPLATKLAHVTIRAQRLLLLRRIDQVHLMIRSYAPDLCQLPGGAATLAQLEAQLREAQRHVQELRLG